MLNSDNLKKRRGLITASEIHKILKPKGFGDTGESYLLQKVAEKLTFQSEENFSSKETNWGEEWESTAIEFYEKATNSKILKSGINSEFLHNDFYGCTPDGIIESKNGLIEVKCPFTIVSHCKNLLLKNSNDLKDWKTENYWQIQFQLFFTNREFCDFISFHPYYTEHQLFALRIEKNLQDIEFMNNRLLLAIEFIKEKLNYINKLN